MTFETILCYALLLSLGVFLGAFWVRAVQWRNKRLNRPKYWPIKTIPAHEIDPLFTYNNLGPTRSTLIDLVASYHVSGAISEYETWVICNLARQAASVFELGTCTGKTAWLMAKNAPQAQITTLTLRPTDVANYKNVDGDDPKTLRDAAAESVLTQFYYQGTPEEERITQLYGDSKDFDETRYLKSFDIVFVDGSHARSYVLSDSHKALAMVKPGGLVLWHDYSGPFSAKDVFEVLNELSETVELNRIEGTAFAVHRAAR